MSHTDTLVCNSVFRCMRMCTEMCAHAGALCKPIYHKLVHLSWASNASANMHNFSHIRVVHNKRATRECPAHIFLLYFRTQHPWKRVYKSPHHRKSTFILRMFLFVLVYYQFFLATIFFLSWWTHCYNVTRICKRVNIRTHSHSQKPSRASAPATSHVN